MPSTLSRTTRLATAIGLIWIGAADRVSNRAAIHPAPPGIILPEPTGRAGVGTTRWSVSDESRLDPFMPAMRRQIEVIAWYPTDVREGQPAPYLREGLPEVRSFATVAGEVGMLDALAQVSAHALIDAPPIGGRARLPLLLFSHGYTGIPSAYTSLLEDLASHGYVVLNIVHPFEASAATLSDGRVVSMLDEARQFRPLLRTVFAEWALEDAAMTAVTSSGDRTMQLAMLRKYLSGLRETSRAVGRWVDDTRAVVARWPDQPRDSPAGRLMSRSDLTRFGVLGHSMGGVVAGDFCLAELRCRAVLNLDGSPQYGTMIDVRLNRPLMMVYSARAGRAGASDAIYESSAERYYRADVADTLHLDFSDMTLWPPLRARRMTGAVPPLTVVATTRVLVREFFDQELRGRTSDVLARRRTIAGATVRRLP